MNRDAIVAILRDQSSEMTERFGVTGVRLFGSVARGEAKAGSDVDLLIDFDGPATYSAILGLSEFLEELIGAHVDLLTTKGISPKLLKLVEREAIRVA